MLSSTLGAPFISYINVWQSLSQNMPPQRLRIQAAAAGTPAPTRPRPGLTAAFCFQPLVPLVFRNHFPGKSRSRSLIIWAWYPQPRIQAAAAASTPAPTRPHPGLTATFCLHPLAVLCTQRYLPRDIGTASVSALLLPGLLLALHTTAFGQYQSPLSSVPGCWCVFSLLSERGVSSRSAVDVREAYGRGGNSVKFDYA